MTDWTATTRRRLRKLLQDTILLDNGALREDMAKRVATLGNEARYLYAVTAPRATPSRVLPGKSRKADRAERRERHRAETARIREIVFRRAMGRCERVFWIGADEPYRCGKDASELHHLVGGVGRRRQQQTVENCRAYCFECHRAAHRARSGARRDERGDGK